MVCVLLVKLLPKGDISDLLLILIHSRFSIFNFSSSACIVRPPRGASERDLHLYRYLKYGWDGFVVEFKEYFDSLV